jgi:hypothetical protein
VAWSKRGSKRHYYRYRRDGRRVIRVYVGGGTLGQLAADADALRRARSDAQAEARTAERARWEEALATLLTLHDGGSLLAHAALLAAGYHRHDRGQWRRRMQGRREAMSGNTKVAEIDPGLIAQLQALVKRGNDGDPAALAALRQTLDLHPEIWQHHGDLAALSQASWLHLIAGPDVLLGESVRRKAEELRARLAGPSPSPLERLLVDVIVSGWLQSTYADASFAQAADKQTTPAALRELQGRQESAQRRLLAAVKQLALVKKLLMPAVSPFDVALRVMPESTTPTRRRAPSRGTVEAAQPDPVLN